MELIDQRPVPVALSEQSRRTRAIREYAGLAPLIVFSAIAFVIPTRLSFLPLGNAGRPAVIWGLALLLLWLLTLLIRRGLPPGGQPIRWVVSIYLGIAAIGLVTGYSRGLVELESNSADRWLIVNLAMAGVILCFADGPRTRKQLDLLLWVLLGFGVFAAIVGAAQFFLSFDLQRHIRVPGLSPLTNLVEIRQRGTGQVSRVAGLSTHYIEFSVVLAALTLLALHFALYARDRFQRLVRWSVFAIIASAIPLSVSRSGIVALAIGLLTMSVVWSWRLRYNILVGGIIALLMFRAVVPGVLGTIRALFTHFGDDPSVEGRTRDYAIVFPMIYDRLITGRGAGTFMPERYIVLDNQFLYTAVSEGLIGLIGFLGLFLGGMAIARSVRRRARIDEDRHLAQTLCAGIAAFLVTSLTFDSLSFVQFRSVLAILLGVVGALWRLSGTRPTDPAVTVCEPTDRVMPPIFPDYSWARRRRPHPVAAEGARAPNLVS